MGSLPLSPAICHASAFALALRRSAVLIDAGKSLLRQSVESGSIRVYESALRCFEDFLSSSSLSLGLSSVPAARPAPALRMLIEIDGVVTAFISFCSIRELSPATVSSYIDGLRFFSTDLDGVASIPNLEVVSRLLTGLAKSGKRPLPRKAGIPCALLRRIIASLPSVPGLSAYDVTLYSTCFIVCYFGAFRVSEFLFSSDQMKLLSRDRVSFHIDGSVRFILPKTKNNSAGPAQEVLFPSLAPDPICPVSAVRSFLARRPVTLGSAPFFIDQSRSPVLPKRFTDVLRLALSAAGILDPESFSSKSFRVGAASDAFALSVPESSIKALGRWKSSAFMDYVRDSARSSLAADVQALLASGSA